MSGGIPSAFGRLSNLGEFVDSLRIDFLSSHLLPGIHSCNSSCSFLLFYNLFPESLMLNSNELEGTLPIEISFLTKLSE